MQQQALSARQEAERSAGRPPDHRPCGQSPDVTLSDQRPGEERIGGETKQSGPDAGRQGDRPDLADGLIGATIFLGLRHEDPRDDAHRIHHDKLEYGDADEQHIGGRRVGTQLRQHGDVDLGHQGGDAERNEQGKKAAPEPSFSHRAPPP